MSEQKLRNLVDNLSAVFGRGETGAPSPQGRLDESLNTNSKFLDTTASYANTFRGVRVLLINHGILPMPAGKKYLTPVMMPSTPGTIGYVVEDSIAAVEQRSQGTKFNANCLDI
ncbi:hypothetical protein PHYPSEUDO_004078 [Phytophthora pseudosyringae]|uniref:Uncharacterized protein n=1 Tax=Phytophthora pseudosyringae TaxID=221518 RepID=A0A8T1VSV0_9STRA|nr:hypothetical protein PHYPSEUDO_004078 [Phytophthora pseudosyringae]